MLVIHSNFNLSHSLFVWCKFELLHYVNGGPMWKLVYYTLLEEGEFSGAKTPLTQINDDD